METRMTKTAYITVGISASGKSTWARDFKEGKTNITEINRDEIRWIIMADKGLHPCWANWKWKWEKEVTEIAEGVQESAIADGRDIIFSDTNLNKYRRETLKGILQKQGYKVEVKIFDVDYDEAVRRDAARQNGVGPWVIAKQFEQFNDEFGVKVVEDMRLPSIVLVDIDGTVALMNGRSPFEWHRVGEDVSHEIVCSIVKGLQAQGKRVIFFSGRDGICFSETFMWLRDRFGDKVELFMRAPGDQRNDAIVKEEMYNKHIAGKYHVEAVIDDRPRVCKMWRRLGFNVIQIGNPYVDF